MGAQQACPCVDTELRFKAMVDGRRMCGAQCVRCGRAVGGWVKKTDWPIVEVPWDETLRSIFWDNWYSKLEKKYAATKEARRQEYEEHLASPEWAATRRLVFEREKNLCQGCRQARGEHVHHLTYERLGRELLTDLVLFCRACHERAHEKGAA